MGIVARVAIGVVLACLGQVRSVAASPDIFDSLQLQQSQLSVKMMLKDPKVRDFLKDSDQGLQIEQIQFAHGVKTAKFKHSYKGLEVLGSNYFYHEAANGIDRQNSIVRFSLDVNPSITSGVAIGIAHAATGGRRPRSLPRLVVLPHADRVSASLVYIVEIEALPSDAGFDIWIDAHSGVVLANVPAFESVAVTQTLTYLANQRCQTINALSGVPGSIVPEDCDRAIENGHETQFSDLVARQANSNAVRVLEYFRTEHHREGYDNAHAMTVSIGHLGYHWNNAAWLPRLKVIGYGDGDRETYRPFTGALDVAGHELTHAVISETAKLIPFGDSGAVSEAFADFFGIMIAHESDWNLGRDLFVDRKHEPLRCLQEPHDCHFQTFNAIGRMHRVPYPKTMSEKVDKPDSCDSTNDLCWIHVNASILGHGFFRIYQRLGRKKTQRLIYLTLTQYLNEGASFKDVRDQSMNACRSLLDARDCEGVNAEWQAVGL